MTEKNTEEGLLPREKKEEIVRIFENIDFAYPLDDIIEELESNEHPDTGKIVLDAIHDCVLDISDIENDGTVYIALGLEGENIWRELNSSEDENKNEDENEEI